MHKSTALITGSARRIGAGIARYLHGLEFNIIVHCNQSIAEGALLVEELNAIRSNSAILIAINLNSEESSKKLIDDALVWSKHLDVLINNASIFSQNANDWDLMFLTNVKVPFWLSNYAYKSLAKTNGCIVNITDTHANTPLKEYAMYCQTKAAFFMQTKALAREFAPLVRVNAVAPGAIIWPEGDNAIALDNQQLIIKKTLLKKAGNVNFIAQAVFAMIDNKFITGQELKVDGGRNI